MLWGTAFGRGRREPEQDLAPQLPASVVRESPGLASLFSGLSADRSHHVLDLGPADGANLELYSRFACTVRFGDLFRSADAHPGRPPSPAFDALPPAGEDPYDLVLAWDALNYLDHPERRFLVTWLDEHCAPGARLYATIDGSDAMSQWPLRITLLDTCRFVARTTDRDTRPGPDLAPAVVERTLDPFRVERAYVLRHRVREYVAVRA